MQGQIESLLERGIEAARGHDTKRARDTLLHVIELDQRNEQAWLWLSSVVESRVDKEVCLENVLLINPDNTYAAMGLQSLRQEPRDPFAPESLLPRLKGSQTASEREWGHARDEVVPPPAQRTCPRCGFTNPGWAYLCDRCGAHLRHLDLREEIREEAERRGRSILTLPEAWVAAFVFNRLWAFRPEIELASWGRSAAALVIAALFASVWRTLMSFLLWLMSGDGQWSAQIGFNALWATVQTLPSALLLVLAFLPIAILTWTVASLIDGRCSFKTHSHLTAVAFSAWIVLIALLAPLTILVPYLVGGDTDFALPFDILAVLVSLAVSTGGALWLIQAIHTAHRLSATRAIVAALLAALVGAVFVLILNLITGGEFADQLSRLVVRPFLPLPNLEL